MAKYPKVNYIGNKEKLVKWIIKEMPVENGTVLDIFAGGCSVSYALKNSGFSVIANDILYADYVIAKALVENSDTKLSVSVFDKKVSDKRVEELSEKFSYRLFILFGRSAGVKQISCNCRKVKGVGEVYDACFDSSSNDKKTSVFENECALGANSEAAR